MPSAAMNRLMDHARVRLPGALDGTIQTELFGTMDEFFKESNIWTEDVQFTANPTLDTFVQNPDAYTYFITPSQGEIIQLLGCWNADGITQAARMPVLGELILSYPPASSSTYTAKVALTVSDNVLSDGYPQFPDWVLRKYSLEILDGILGRMMSQAAKPYSNAALAGVHLRRFKTAKMQAKVEAQRQNVYRAQSWRFPQTFNR